MYLLILFCFYGYSSGHQQGEKRWTRQRLTSFWIAWMIGQRPLNSGEHVDPNCALMQSPVSSTGLTRWRNIMSHNVTKQVEIRYITPFKADNHHRPLDRDGNYRVDYQVCISMQPMDGNPIWLVTFTNDNTEFAKSVKVGDKLTVSGTFKRFQTNRNGEQEVLTNCKIVNRINNVAMASNGVAGEVWNGVDTSVHVAFTYNGKPRTGIVAEVKGQLMTLNLDNSETCSRTGNQIDVKHFRIDKIGSDVVLS